MTKQTFFYVSPMWLEAGTIIPPGNFGKNIFSHTPNRGSNGWPLVRELIFEQVRQQLRPDAPSRLYCNFVFPDSAVANIGCTDLATEVLAPSIYEVECIDMDPLLAFGNFALIKQVDGGRYVDSARDLAKLYWATPQWPAQSTAMTPEILTTSAIKIVRPCVQFKPHCLISNVVNGSA